MVGGKCGFEGVVCKNKYQYQICDPDKHDITRLDGKADEKAARKATKEKKDEAVIICRYAEGKNEDKFGFYEYGKAPKAKGAQPASSASAKATAASTAKPAAKRGTETKQGDKTQEGQRRGAKKNRLLAVLEDTMDWMNENPIETIALTLAPFVLYYGLKFIKKRRERAVEEGAMKMAARLETRINIDAELRTKEGFAETYKKLSTEQKAQLIKHLEEDTYKDKGKTPHIGWGNISIEDMGGKPKLSIELEGDQTVEIDLQKLESKVRSPSIRKGKVKEELEKTQWFQDITDAAEKDKVVEELMTENTADIKDKYKVEIHEERRERVKLSDGTNSVELDMSKLTVNPANVNKKVLKAFNKMRGKLIDLGEFVLSAEILNASAVNEGALGAATNRAVALSDGVSVKDAKAEANKPVKIPQPTPPPQPKSPPPPPPRGVSRTNFQDSSFSPEDLALWQQILPAFEGQADAVKEEAKKQGSKDKLVEIFKLGLSESWIEEHIEGDGTDGPLTKQGLRVLLETGAQAKGEAFVSDNKALFNGLFDESNMPEDARRVLQRRVVPPPLPTTPAKDLAKGAKGREKVEGVWARVRASARILVRGK